MSVGDSRTPSKRVLHPDVEGDVAFVVLGAADVNRILSVPATSSSIRARRWSRSLVSRTGPTT